MKEKARIGYIKISYELLKETELLKEAFFKLDVWVLGIESAPEYGAKKYVIESKYLAEVSIGEVTPEYLIEVSFGEENSYSFKKVQD